MLRRPPPLQAAMASPGCVKAALPVLFRSTTGGLPRFIRAFKAAGPLRASTPEQPIAEEYDLRPHDASLIAQMVQGEPLEHAAAPIRDVKGRMVERRPVRYLKSFPLVKGSVDPFGSLGNRHTNSRTGTHQLIHWHSWNRIKCSLP
jgi:hypothetical protein